MIYKLCFLDSPDKLLCFPQLIGEIMFVEIEKNKKSVPSNEDIRKAMRESGSDVTNIEGNNSHKRVDFIMEVNHNDFENNLIKVAKGKRTSWNFTWADD